MSTRREHEPAVKYCCTTFATITGLNAEGRRDSLDDIAQPNLLLNEEAREPHSIRLAVMLVLMDFLNFCLIHTSCLLPYNVAIT
jgi:hypothetical protein